MVVCASVSNHLRVSGLSSLSPNNVKISTSERFKHPTRTNTSRNRQHCRICCSMAPLHTTISTLPLDKHGIHGILQTDLTSLVLADLDPSTAKLAIGILGPSLSAFAFLFIVRIVMSWYPKLPVGKFPYVIAYAPTEPILIPTRKLIAPVGGVDVTPVVWFGLLSFMNEILLGPQGLLVLLSQQVN